MAKMTKRRALKECIAVWGWLAKHPEVRDKEDVPDSILPKHYDNLCPCCEYYAEMPVTDEYRPCESACPLHSLWPDGCCTAYSPYTEWEHACDNETRKHFAKKIVAGAKKALKKLDKKKGRK